MFTGISVMCEVGKGTFMSEYFVRIKTYDGTVWEGAVDKEMVFDLEGIPTEEKYVKGRMYAYLISLDEEKSIALIELPIEDSTSGRRILVPLSSVRKERVPA
ncbi:MAG: hypothetical protein DRP84_11880 [Spirochaetes bacterium]|nr:MAG: hypothetical protein DRP84_11880 [Spirochaetota bacterium]